MDAHSTSFLSRCRQVCFGNKAKSSRQSQSQATRSWPRASDSYGVRVDLHEDDLSLLLEETHNHTHDMSQRRKSIASTSGCVSTTRSLAVPPWCRLPTSSRFTILLIAILSLASSAFAAPLLQGRNLDLVERQSVPDRFGNTGNNPAPIGVRPSPQAENPTTRASPTPTAVASSASIVVSPTNTAVSSPATDLPNPSGFPSPLGPFFTPRPTTSPPTTNPENQLQRVEPQNILSPASIAGIVLGGVILIILTILCIFLCRRRRKAREIREISIRRSKIGSRLANRVFGQHYDETIARSRSKKIKQKKYPDDSVASWGNVSKEMILEAPPPSIKVTNPPISPSIYSTHRLTRATRMSTMTFGSMGGWLDKTATGPPQPRAFTGTPSQLLDAPKPLFAKEQKVAAVASWKGDISPPRPARPGSAEPLGRLSGMGFGLGMR